MPPSKCSLGCTAFVISIIACGFLVQGGRPLRQSQGGITIEGILLHPPVLGLGRAGVAAARERVSESGGGFLRLFGQVSNSEQKPTGGNSIVQAALTRQSPEKADSPVEGRSSVSVERLTFGPSRPPLPNVFGIFDLNL